MKKRLFGIATAALMATSMLFPTVAFAATKPSIQKATYDGKGYVDIDFKYDVQYKSPKVTVKDSAGKSYTTSIRDRDEDDLEFRINSYTTGKTYTYTISGVRVRGESAYTSVSGTVSIPGASSKAAISKVKYDGSGEVEVDFKAKVQYKNAKVTLKDSTGKSYSATITDYDDDELDFDIKSYKAGLTYTFTISGIRPRGATSYSSITGKVSIPKASSGSRIGETKAKEIALKHAGLKSSQVKFTKAKLDKDDGVEVYDVEFYRGNWEYDYEIHAKSGKILEWDKEYDD